MDGLIAAVVVGAVAFLGLAAAPQVSAGRREPRSSFVDRAIAARDRELRAARLSVDARKFTLICWSSPPALLALGLLLGSPVVAFVGCAIGFFLPRLYIDHLINAQRRRTEAEAPRMLQIMLASLTAGRTYLETLQEARARATDRWLRDDLDHIIGQFHLDVPLERSIADVRTATAGRNLGLIWDNLAICIANRIPASKAKGLFVELSSTVQFNVQVQQEVRARTSGQRAQIWMLAAIVPGLFIYLRVINPEFFTVLDETVVGRFVLFPLAMCLEVLGVVLSVRVSRVEV